MCHQASENSDAICVDSEGQRGGCISVVTTSICVVENFAYSISSFQEVHLCVYMHAHMCLIIRSPH